MKWFGYICCDIRRRHLRHNSMLPGLHLRSVKKEAEVCPLILTTDVVPSWKSRTRWMRNYGTVLAASIFQRAWQSTEWNAALNDAASMNTAWRRMSNSAKRRRARLASAADLPEVKPDSSGRLCHVWSVWNLAGRSCAKTFPGTDRSDTGLQLLQWDFGPFHLHRDVMIPSLQSAWTILVDQTLRNRTCVLFGILKFRYNVVGPRRFAIAKFSVCLQYFAQSWCIHRDIWIRGCLLCCSIEVSGELVAGGWFSISVQRSFHLPSTSFMVLHRDPSLLCCSKMSGYTTAQVAQVLLNADSRIVTWRTQNCDRIVKFYITFTFSKNSTFKTKTIICLK